ncbi:MAG: phosphoenolpyruvate carboxykinase (ATP) [Saprospiraceae bacterium]
MTENGIRNPSSSLEQIGFKGIRQAYWNQSAEALIEETIRRYQGVLSSTGALVIETGEFTGRSPKDKFTVKDAETENSVDWNNFNIPFEEAAFEKLRLKMLAYFAGKDLFVKDAYACADEKYRLNLRLYSEYPWSNMFAHNMFLRPTLEEIRSFEAEWTIINAPGFKADPVEDGTRQHNFAVIHFKRKTILIGGTGYTGEIKKGIFSVLNYLLPHEQNVLAMHCSANLGKEGDTAIFFGLSGTGKTTLSADPDRFLIGDDEHGWSDEGVFNFEGGCYAKTIDLSAEKEPDIYKAIKHGAILENICFMPHSREVDYACTELTENTRVSYPLFHIENALEKSVGGHPKNIFFLTCDADGVLPPISQLTPGQAMYQFISGYTAKVAGTEVGITEPVKTFSTCFGAPFMPLHPTKYATMLGERMQKYNTKVWLVNTGWTGGQYGVGNRMKLSHTRAMITAALNGGLDQVEFQVHPVFGFKYPLTCPGVPSDVLDARNTWSDKSAYDDRAKKLAEAFVKNFEKFADKAHPEILEAGPKIAQEA